MENFMPEDVESDVKSKDDKSPGVDGITAETIQSPGDNSV